MSNNKQQYREIKWIPCKQLSLVWAEAQRPLNESHAKSIADNFDPEMFGTIAVTKPNGAGIYHIIDGHHRQEIADELERQIPDTMKARNMTREQRDTIADSGT